MDSRRRTASRSNVHLKCVFDVWLDIINSANPAQKTREEFFNAIITYIKKAPKDFPEPLNRKKRKLEVLEIAPPPPPKPPTKAEIKAQKQRDHQLLNLLKIQIQPIMDQIQKKYRKFRAPVIQQSQIQYLYDEADPNYVRPDIATFRPFELDVDKDGVKGLRETSSGKFFYNLETTTIEERLSNGFYARPKDFLADIRSLAKDAKHIGDKERTLRANELLSNVEVDIGLMEAQPVFADCENVYLRQLQRAKEKEEKRRKREGQAAGFISALSRPDTDLSGPVRLGVTVPGSLPALATPLHSSDSLSNGVSAKSNEPHMSNGTSNGNREDVEMGGTDDNPQETSPTTQSMQPSNQQWPSNLSGLATAGNTQGNTQISQRSGFQEISRDFSPHAMINDASTTTSGKKTSEGWSTQATNGVTPSSPVERPAADSQLPDTQGNPESQLQDTADDAGKSGTSSDDPWPHSQAHGLARGAIAQTYPSQTTSSGNSYSQNPAVPAFTAPSRLQTGRKPSGFANILNDSPIEVTSSQASSQKDFILDEYFLAALLKQFTEGSSGCSVEQLEQINRELMETLWEMRGEYNRNRVAAKLGDVFNDTILDIEEMQKVLQASQPSQLQS